MRFSILVPVYNVEKYLVQCIESVLNQTYQDFELILVDDGSTDESGHICDKYAEKYRHQVKILHQANSGQLISRMVAMNEASGEYCIFLDADDLLSDNCLELVQKTICENQLPDVVIYSFYYMDETGKCNKANFPFQTECEYAESNIKELYQMFFEYTALNSMCTKTVKREVLLKSKIDIEKYSKLRCSEDRLQSMEIITNAKKVVCIDQALYYYRLAQGSTTRQFCLSSIDKFNTRVLCDIEKEYLDLWKLELPKWADKLEANFLNQTMYIFTDFYDHMTDKTARKQLIRYDWSSFVEPAYLEHLESNLYVKQPYKKLWDFILHKNYFAIKRFLIKREMYRKLRKIKRTFVAKKFNLNVRK